MKKQIFLLFSILIFGSLLTFAQENPTRTISGGVVNGKAVSLPAPAYPAAAQAVGAQGAVSVQVLIDENGIVISAKAASGHPLLRSAAESAARNAIFRPTLLQGQPVKVSGVITYVFNSSRPNPADQSGSAGDIPANTSGNIVQEREKLNYLTLSTIIRILTKINADDNLKAVAQKFFNDFAEGLGSEELPEELEFIKELATAPKERRAEVLSVFNSTLRESASDNQIWYINFGEDLGDLIAETLKRTAIGGTGSSQTKLSLLKIKNSLNSAPPDFPIFLRGLLIETIEFSERNNLADVDILSELDDKIIEIGDIIFEENE